MNFRPLLLRRLARSAILGMPTPTSLVSSLEKIFSGGPSSSTSPSLNIITLLTCLTARSILCSIRIIVILWSRFRASRTSKIFSAPTGSKKDVGSSITMTLGRMARMDEMVSLCFWPPESSWVALSLRLRIPVILMAHSISSTILSLGTPRFSSPNATSFSTVRANIWLSGFWKIRPTCLASSMVGWSLVERLATLTSPLSSPL